MTFPKCRWHQKKKLQHAVMVGNAHANGMFKDFSEKPNFQGRNFKWSHFAELVRDLTRVSAFMSFPGTCKQEIYDLAAETAFNRATELVKETNLV